MGLENLRNRIYEETERACSEMFACIQEYGSYSNDQIIRVSGAIAKHITAHIIDNPAVCNSLISNTYGKAAKKIRIVALSSILSDQIRRQLYTKESLIGLRSSYTGDFYLVVQGLASIIAESIIESKKIQQAVICYLQELIKNREAA